MEQIRRRDELMIAKGLAERGEVAAARAIFAANHIIHAAVEINRTEPLGGRRQ